MKWKRSSDGRARRALSSKTNASALRGREASKGTARVRTASSYRNGFAVSYRAKLLWTWRIRSLLVIAKPLS